MNFFDFPSFADSIDYRELHPTIEGNRRWRYITLKDVSIELDIDSRRCGDISFCDKRGKEWMRIKDGILTIRKGYAWNGCTPKYWSVILQRWVGTPDFRETILPSLFHDALYQFSRTNHFPFHKSEVDDLFYNMISRAGAEKIAGVYHAAVKKFGKWTDKPTNGEYSEIL